MAVKSGVFIKAGTHIGVPEERRKREYSEEYETERNCIVRSYILLCIVNRGG
jgi:hypothetical protein